MCRTNATKIHRRVHTAVTVNWFTGVVAFTGSVALLRALDALEPNQFDAPGILYSDRDLDAS